MIQAPHRERAPTQTAPPSAHVGGWPLLATSYCPGAQRSGPAFATRSRRSTRMSVGDATAGSGNLFVKCKAWAPQRDKMRTLGRPASRNTRGPLGQAIVEGRGNGGGAGLPEKHESGMFGAFDHEATPEDEEGGRIVKARRARQPPLKNVPFLCFFSFVFSFVSSVLSSAAQGEGDKGAPLGRRCRSGTRFWSCKRQYCCCHGLCGRINN